MTAAPKKISASEIEGVWMSDMDEEKAKAARRKLGLPITKELVYQRSPESEREHVSDIMLVPSQLELEDCTYRTVAIKNEDGRDHDLPIMVAHFQEMQH